MAVSRSALNYLPEERSGLIYVPSRREPVRERPAQSDATGKFFPNPGIEIPEPIRVFFPRKNPLDLHQHLSLKPAAVHRILQYGMKQLQSFFTPAQEKQDVPLHQPTKNLLVWIPRDRQQAPRFFQSLLKKPLRYLQFNQVLMKFLIERPGRERLSPDRHRLPGPSTSYQIQAPQHGIPVLRGNRASVLKIRESLFKVQEAGLHPRSRQPQGGIVR